MRPTRQSRACPLGTPQVDIGSIGCVAEVYGERPAVHEMSKQVLAVLLVHALGQLRGASHLYSCKEQAKCK